MKVLKWFKVGEPIPNSALYLRSETRQENVEYHHEHDLLPDSKTWDEVEYCLYEVQVEE